MLFFSKKKHGLAQKAQFLCFFCPFLRFFGPKKALFPCFGIFYPRFFVKTALFRAPKCPRHYEKSKGRNDTKKAQETKKTWKGGSGYFLLLWSFSRRPALSGPVLHESPRDYLSDTPLACALWGSWCLNMANWVRYPLPHSWALPPWRTCEVEVRYPPPHKRLSERYLCDTHENKEKGGDTPLCDTISKGYCAIWGVISHWAAKGPPPHNSPGNYFRNNSGESNRPLTPILLKSMAIHLPFLLR